MTEVQTQSDHMRLTRTRVGGSVPFVARVGVTGHRRIASDDLERLNYEIGCAFTKVGELFNVGGATPLQVRVVTSLAEGADRMVAKAVLQMDGQLEVILPVPVSQYMVDFESPESRAEFEDLLAHAGPPREGPEFASRADSYAWASRQMVEGSDVLIAIWDGQPTRGKGGTADTVRYALATRTPVIWIPMDGSGLKWDTGEGPVDRAFGNAGAERAGRSLPQQLPMKRVRSLVDYLDHYNSVPDILGRKCAALLNGNLLDGTDDDPIGMIEGRFRPDDDIGQLIRWIHPHYVWADRRSLFFQQWYQRGITFVFSASLSAVVVAATVLVFGLPREWFALEAVLLIFVLAAVLFGLQIEMHDQWLDCRFVAERLRSLIFLKAAGVTNRRDDAMSVTGLRAPYDSWMRYLLGYAWKHSPPVESTSNHRLRELLVEGWIRPQIEYYRRQSKRHQSRQTRLFQLSVVLLLCIIAGAFWHAFGVTGPWDRPVSLLAIILPALGSTVAGISAHRQHRRHAVIYSRMAETLGLIERQLVAAESSDEIRRLVLVVDNTMNTENRDWLGVMKFHDFEFAG